MSDKDSGLSKDGSHDVDGLNNLLDDALKGFTERPRTTDDELDEIMAEQDQAAAQKAAGDFQAMLQQMVKVQEEALRQAESSGQHVAEYEEETKNMIDAMKALMECSGKSTDSPVEPVMSMILQTLASKAVMYPPLKEIHDNYPGFFAEHGVSLDSETRQRYEKQYEIIGKICREFEKEPDVQPELVQKTECSIEQKKRSIGVIDSSVSNFETLGKLLVELQSYGYPPKEITGDLPAGWAVDDTTGLPKVSDVSAAAGSCILM